MRWLIVCLLLAPLSLAACSSEEPKEQPLCAARKTIYCLCPKTGEAGVQTCLPDGSGYDACGPCDGSRLEPSGQGGSGGSGMTFTDIECGNGKTESGEQCDDGNFDTDDDCVDCRKAQCGDGYLHVGDEDCDDGNSVDNDGCSNDCKTKVLESEKCPGESLEVNTDPAGKTVKGSFKSYQPNHEGDCGSNGGGEGRDAVFSFKAPSNGECRVALFPADAQVDVVVYARKSQSGAAADCDESSNQVACSNFGVPPSNEVIKFPVVKGSTYFVFADSYNQIDGDFSLNIRVTPDESCEGEGDPCEAEKVDGQAEKKGECAKGALVCQGGTLVCQLKTSSAEVCGDNLDNDCDGIVDNNCPCAHDVCTVSAEAPLVAGCKGEDGQVDKCVQSVCEKDDFCCTTGWDETCASEVATYCGLASCIKDKCAHAICESGAALEIGCDGDVKCVEAICQTDSFCCGKEWDSTCTDKIPVVCSLTCP